MRAKWIKKRRRWRYDIYGRLPDGRLRFICPFHAGKLWCDEIPPSSKLRDGAKHVALPVGTTKCCNGTFTAPLRDLVKIGHQEPPYFSAAHARVYNTRIPVEGRFGIDQERGAYAPRSCRAPRLVPHALASFVFDAIGNLQLTMNKEIEELYEIIDNYQPPTNSEPSMGRPDDDDGPTDDTGSAEESADDAGLIDGDGSAEESADDDGSAEESADDAGLIDGDGSAEESADDDGSAEESADDTGSAEESADDDGPVDGDGSAEESADDTGSADESADDDGPIDSDGPADESADDGGSGNEQARLVDSPRASPEPQHATDIDNSPDRDRRASAPPRAPP